MKLKDLYIYSINVLKESGVENPSLDAFIIISFILKMPKEKILTNFEKEIGKDDVEKVLDFINKRAEGIPVAYLVKGKEFFGLDFYIEEGVLIPRPETEILVEEVLKRLPRDKKITGLDIGVGSGCIAITILKNRPNVSMVGLDISDKAIEISNVNAKKHRVQDRLKVIKLSIFDNPKFDFKFDFIVSNPPYIQSKDYEMLQKEVKREPIEALISGKEGIEFYEKIIQLSLDYLNKGGFLAFEVGIGQAEKVKSMMQRCGFENIDIVKDLNGIERVVIGYNFGGKEDG